MKEFNALRDRALAKRDKAIAYARSDYQKALAQIEELEQQLMGRSFTRKNPLAAAVHSSIPRDKPFSVNDVMHALTAENPQRVVSKAAVTRAVYNLFNHGITRRLKRASSTNGALYVVADASCEPPTALGDMSLAEAIRHVCKRPMTIDEIVVGVKEAGYYSTMKPKSFRWCVRNQLRKMGFREKGGKWTGGNHMDAHRPVRPAGGALPAAGG